MRWPERRGLPAAALLVAASLVAALLGVGSSAGAAASADDPARRHVAPVAIEAAAPLVRLALPVEAYARSRRPRLADLRIVDAAGEPVPFALLPPRADEIGSTESSRSAALYALPPRPSAGGDWASPLEVQVQGDRIRVTRRGSPPLPAAGSGAVRPPPGGWLFDLGERAPDAPAPQALRVGWPEPAEFSAGYSLQTSPDLRRWRAAGAGQLLALGSAGGALTQPLVALPDAVGRFVRLVWAEPVGAPLLTRAEAVWQRPRSTALEPPVELLVVPLPARLDSLDPDDRRALEFDLGGVLPVVALDLELGPGTRVAPTRLQGRDRADAAWRALGASVFYRHEGGPAAGPASVSPPLPLHAELRYLRLIVDARSPLPERSQARLRVQARLASVVFALQGRAPYRVETGADSAAPAALPLATLVPDLDLARPGFGRATLGAWTEDAQAAQRADAAQRLAAWRPWLLWAVLVAGVGGLGFMVWRLARATPPSA